MRRGRGVRCDSDSASSSILLKGGERRGGFLGFLFSSDFSFPDTALALS